MTSEPQFTPISIVSNTTRRSRLGRSAIAAVAAVILVTFVGSYDAVGQIYRGYRPYGVAVVAPPAWPSPYYYGPVIAPPPVAVAPRGIRIRAPFFSLNIEPDLYYAPRYPVYGYRYGADLQRYEDRYRSARPVIPGYSVISPIDQGATSDRPTYRSDYAPGALGGIPDLSTPRQFTLSALRDAADDLRLSLELRGDDGDVWLDYLNPEGIIVSIDRGGSGLDLADLKMRYDGVTMNPSLSGIARSRGFAETRQLLTWWLQESEATGMVSEPSLDASDPSSSQRGPNASDASAPDRGASSPVGPDAEPIPAPLPAPAIEQDGVQREDGDLDTGLDPFAPSDNV